MARTSSGQDSPLILLATGNPAKQQTLGWLLEGLPFRTTTPQQLGLTTEPEEEGDSHEAIARFKALRWSEAASMLSIATDGGLVLPALGDQWESRYTHRFAGPAANDEERVQRLLQLMQPFRGADREASWTEALAIADRGRLLASWELKGGTGLIADAPDDFAQVPGFWAFSLWYFPQFGKTYNRLSDQQRRSLDDHWSQLRELVQNFFRGHLFKPLP
ncbi:MAG: hypothetical protein IH962_04415 [Chloroflexi bacterium]|nr:hypothetical protein [Chloroflexota bacterium]